MRILYIESQKKNHEEIKIDAGKLPKELALAYSIQYKKTAEEIKRQLEAKNIKVKAFIQVLGCSKIDYGLRNFPILLIGSGKFHALNLALQNNNSVYVYNSRAITRINEKDIQELKKRKMNGYNRFLNSEKIGIIVSTKPGQEKMKEADKLAGLIEKKYPSKKVYLLVSNNININEFENFDIDFFINSACPGLLNDSNNLLNIDDILSFLSQ